MSNVRTIKQKAKIVSVELGGKTRTIKFDLNAFAELENKYGTVNKAMEALSEGKIAAVKMVLWAGLIHEEAVLDEVTGEPIKYNITPYQVGGWIDPTDIADIMNKVNQAMGDDLPEQNEKQTSDTTEVVDLNTPAKVVLTEEEKAEQEKNV